MLLFNKAYLPYKESMSRVESILGIAVIRDARPAVVLRYPSRTKKELALAVHTQSRKEK